MKITKSQLRQIIKEELQYVLNEEDSPMEMLGAHDISDSRTLADAVDSALSQGKVNDKNYTTIRNWLTRRIQKEPDEDLRAHMTQLRDDVVRASGYTDREGLTGFERSRASREYHRGANQESSPRAGRMTTLQSLGIGE